jgi:hypothetical protein
MTPLRILRILLDVSASMETIQDNGQTIHRNVIDATLTTMKEIAQAAVDAVDASDKGVCLRIHVDTFNHTHIQDVIPPVDISGSDDDKAILRLLGGAAAEMHKQSLRGSTSLYDTVIGVLNRATESSREGAHTVVISISDGADTASKGGVHDMISAADNAKKNGVTYIAITCDDVGTTTTSALSQAMTPIGLEYVPVPTFGRSNSAGTRQCIHATAGEAMRGMGLPETSPRMGLPETSPLLPLLPPPRAEFDPLRLTRSKPGTYAAGLFGGGAPSTPMSTAAAADQFFATIPSAPASTPSLMPSRTAAEQFFATPDNSNLV